MTSGAPPVRPLDVRREQLRELGHTDAEISAIILKEVPPPQPQAAATGMTGAGGVAGQTGVMSGVLNNLSVAMALATGFLPSIATDITNLLGAHSSLHQRSRAGVFLAVKLALVAVIGFAIFQEYQQHIISATITAVEQAKKIEAERRTAEAQAAASGPSDTPRGMAYRLQKFQKWKAMQAQIRSLSDSKREMSAWMPWKRKKPHMV